MVRSHDRHMIIKADHVTISSWGYNPADGLMGKGGEESSTAYRCITKVMLNVSLTRSISFASRMIVATDLLFLTFITEEGFHLFHLHLQVGSPTCTVNRSDSLQCELSSCSGHTDTVQPLAEDPILMEHPHRRPQGTHSLVPFLIRSNITGIATPEALSPSAI